jgi:hypothetical protein
VQNSYTLALDEAPKFALRYAFLNDIYSRATIMQQIFQQAHQALTGTPFQPGFLSPCEAGDSACQSGGPAAQLMWAYGHNQPSASFPNAVIYGWTDKNLPNGQPGYAHIVKVTAYSPGRCGSDFNGTGGVCGGAPPYINTMLPLARTAQVWLSRRYELRARDGYVYIKVVRWDQDHSNLTFPNNLPLWQLAFHNPNAGSVAANLQGLPPACIGLISKSTGNGASNMGFGLTQQTFTALQSSNIVPALYLPDVPALGSAFMLNDNGTGVLDGNGPSAGYKSCLLAVNTLLDNGISSQACAAYVASDIPGVTKSGDNDQNYKIYFESCPKALPDDLTADQGGL